MDHIPVVITDGERRMESERIEREAARGHRVVVVRDGPDGRLRISGHRAKRASARGGSALRV
jgi:hypothetical protein